jgi:hypothetical protein
MGMTSKPMVDDDVSALMEMVVPYFADHAGPTRA